MQIKIGGTVLVAGQGRSSNGSPVGPANLRMADRPGVAMREYVGADRVQGEHVRCDHGTLTFDAERIFATPADALAYLATGYRSEAKEGALTFDGDVVFAHAAVTGRQIAVAGCAVAVSYTIEG